MGVALVNQFYLQKLDWAHPLLPTSLLHVGFDLAPRGAALSVGDVGAL